MLHCIIIARKDDRGMRKKTQKRGAELTISSKTYSAWSLRGWLLCKLAGLDVTEKMVALDDPGNRAELLLLSPSVLVPRLTHDGASVWDTLAIAEYLNEICPEAQMFPADRLARAHCRSISGEIHSGFANLRSALPMNLKVRHKSFPIFSGAKPDIERIESIWQDCLTRYGGPFLFGETPTVADAKLDAPREGPLEGINEEMRERRLGQRSLRGRRRCLHGRFGHGPES